MTPIGSERLREPAEPSRSASTSQVTGGGASRRISARLGGAGLLTGVVLAGLLSLLPLDAGAAGMLVRCLLGGLVVGGVIMLAGDRLVARPLRGFSAQVISVAAAARASAADGWRDGESPARVAPPGVEELARTATGVNSLIDLLQAERIFRSIVEASGDLLLLLDGVGRVRYASGSLVSALGRSQHEVIGQPLGRYVHAGDLELLFDLVDGHQSLTEDSDFGSDDIAGTGMGDIAGTGMGGGAEATVNGRAEFGDGSLGAYLETHPGTTTDDTDRTRLRLHAADGSWRLVEWVVSARGGAPRRGTVLITGRDVTESVALHAELQHQALHDPITGLPNRAALLREADEIVAAATPGRPVATLVIDLDGFKVVNDSLGHAVGDALLAQVGPRLRSILRPSDIIARLGGDEFVVLLPTAGESGARMVAERLAAQLEDAFVVEGNEVFVAASIGISLSHRAGRGDPATVECLLREADIAMYRAKEERLGIAQFDPEQDARNTSRLELSGALRQGIADGELVVQYQPIIDVEQRRVQAVEALVRWSRPDHGLLPPAFFLQLAEDTGLVVPLSLSVLDQAVAQAAAWARAGWQVPVSVNLSPRWLQQADVPQQVAAALARHGVAPGQLRLEITEGVVLVEPKASLPRLRRLQEMGVGLSLDDFGTGYSSMTHLRSLPVDQIKVDRAFVQAMTTTQEDAVIVQAAVDLGHNLGMSVVAEGIEDAETLTQVMGAGCTLAQGYFFSRPLPAEEVLPWVRTSFPGSVGLVPADAG